MSEKLAASDVLSVRDRVLDAAERVAVRDGVVNLTLESVAREAQLSKGGLLYHFPSKAALITAVVERVAGQCQAEQCQAVESDCSEPGALTRSYLAARTQPFDPKEEPIHAALLAAAGSHPQYLEPFRQRHRQWQALLENDGIDPAISTIVRLAVDGLCLGALLGMPMPREELRQRVIEKLIEMTRAESGEKTLLQTSSEENKS